MLWIHVCDWVALVAWTMGNTHISGAINASAPVPVTNEEPLKRELADFVDAVVSKRAPLVDGHQGRRALALAQQITDRMTTEHQSQPWTRNHEDTKTV